jgi:ABC-type transport system involved in multi-copper enzyme maturation permease subunit
MALAFVLGGLNWFALLGYIAMMIIVAIYVGSIGVFCSSTFKRTIASIVMTFLISFALLVIPYILFFVIYGIGEAVYQSMYYYGNSAYMTIPDLNMGILPMIMLVNPLSGFLDYMLQTMDISSMHELIEEMDAFGTIMPILAYGWIPMNIIVSGGISYFFIRMAAKKLNPIKRIKKKNRKNVPPIVGPTGMQTQGTSASAQPMPLLYQPGQSSQPEPPADATPQGPSTEKLIGGTNVR